MLLLKFILLLIGIFCPILLVNTIITEITNYRVGRMQLPEAIAKVKLMLISLTALSWAAYLTFIL